MTDVSGIGALSQYDISNKVEKESANDQLGKTEFLELMIAKLNNQNPLEPEDDAAFIAELAQFSTVEGIQNMADGFDELAVSYKSAQALQASSLVGGAVTISGNATSTLYAGDLVYGHSEIVTGAENLRLQIVNQAGTLVEDVELGYQPPGEMTFKWDGANLEVNGELMDIDYSKFDFDDAGNIIPHAYDDYTFSIVGTVSGVQESMGVSTSKRVDSVTIKDDHSIQLNLEGGTTAAMADVMQINSVY